MTRRKDLKRRIRERQQTTGECYTVARERVLRGETASEPVARGQTLPATCWVELHDVSTAARAVGFTCPIQVTASLWASREHVPRLLEELRTLLSRSNPALGPLRRAAIDNEAADTPFTIPMPDLRQPAVERFFEALNAGIRGPALDGNVLSFDSRFDDQPRTIIAQLFPQHRVQTAFVPPSSPQPVATITPCPSIVLSQFRPGPPAVLATAPEAWAYILPLPRAEPSWIR